MMNITPTYDILTDTESVILPFAPLGPVVIVLPKASAPPSTESGIQIADIYNSEPTSGLVVAVGTGFRCSCCEAQREASVKVGDLVVFDRGSGELLPYAVEGEDCVLLHEDELLAVVTSPAAVCEVV
jgi:co-chaperonin GroES (HSP10)